MMIPHAIGSRINRRLFYGYVMIGFAFLGMFASGPGQSFNISVFVNPLLEELGISRTSISTAYAIGTMTAAFALPYVGRLIDRFGPRALTATVSVLLGFVCLGFPLVSGVAALYVAFTLVRFLGQGSLMLVSTNLAAQWFSRRRGMAMSVTTLGFAAASASFPPVVQYTIGLVGWRQTWMLEGVFVWALMVPLALLVVVNRPEDIGVRPDGDSPRARAAEPAPPSATAEADATATPAPEPDETEERSYTQAEALRMPVFWVMCFALSTFGLLVTGIVFHQISYFEEQGLDAQVGATVFTVTAISMVVCLPLMGWLLDRYPTRYIVSAGLFVMALAMWVMNIADTVALAMTFGIVLGVASAAMLTNVTYVWPAYFGRKYLGSIQGAAQTVSILSSSLGPLPFGLGYDLLGGYHEAVLALSVLPIVLGVVVLFFKPPAQARG